jgi:hypothetical protein
MQLPRLFARKPRAAKETVPTGRPVGGSGRFHADGFLEIEELNADLQGLTGCRTYDRMWRTDPDVRRAWGMWANPIIAGTWTVDPYGGDDATDEDRADADLVEWALCEHLRGGLRGHLSEALPMLRQGHAAFEQIWHTTSYDGQMLLVPMYLGARLSRSIHRWFQDDYEQLSGIEQMTLKAGMVRLDASDLVYYRVGAEGDNWEGTSPLRAIYKPWYFKDVIERLDAIAQERHAVGLPIVYPPENAGDGDLDSVQEALEAISSGDRPWLLMPGPHAQDVQDGQPGWRFEMQGQGGPTQGGRDAQPSLSYHTDKIAAGLIAEFMRLGQSGTGARATADVQQDPFYIAVEGFTSTIIEPPLRALAERIIRVNRGERGGYPNVRMSLVDSTSLTELKDYVSGLVMQGAMQPDEPLEDYLRDRADLPPADPAERQRRKQQRDQMDQATLEQAKNPQPAPGQPGGQNGPQDPAKPGAKPTAGGGEADKAAPGGPSKTADTQDVDRATFGRQARDLRHWEQHMSLDRIEAAIDGARAQFETAGATAARAAVRTVLTAVDKGKDPPARDAELETAIGGVIDDLYALGRSTVAEELARQASGKTPASFARGKRPEPALTRRAKLAARNVLAAIIKTVLGRHLAGDTPGQLQAAGEQTAAASLRAEAQLHAAAALNEGRSDQADDLASEIRGSRYTSILDGARCDTCAGADDDVLRPLSDPVRLERKPPNRDCYGGDRCRCLEFFELDDEAPPS